MTAVVYVHGLWMPGDEAFILKHRLAQEFGLSLRAFRYSGTSESMGEVTERLDGFVRDLHTDAVHFIGHSLGGLVIYRFFERFPVQPAGNVVFLGTPGVASRAAERAGRFAPFAQLLEASVAAELLHPQERRWSHARPLGIIAGTEPMGFGQLLAEFDEEHDGTIGVSETRLPGATAHLVLPVSHFALLLSETVARETGRFLTEGRFSSL